MKLVKLEAAATGAATVRRATTKRMSRFKRLKNWPDCLSTMTVEQLRQEITYWQSKARFLGHPTARKGAMKRSREAEEILEQRLATENRTE